MKLRLVSTWNLLLQLLLLLGAVGAYTSPETTTSRRRLFQSVGAAVGVVAAAAPAQANQYCASGVGEGCADLSEGNDLIRSLQEKSAANREKNERVRAFWIVAGCCCRVLLGDVEVACFVLMDPFLSSSRVSRKPGKPFT
jgi:hypothetical protein